MTKDTNLLHIKTRYSKISAEIEALTHELSILQSRCPHPIIKMNLTPLIRDWEFCCFYCGRRGKMDDDLASKMRDLQKKDPKSISGLNLKGFYRRYEK